MTRTGLHLHQPEYPTGRSAGLGHATGRGHAGAVAVEEHLDHHLGMVGRAAPPFLLVSGRNRRGVQLVHHVGDEVGQVVRRQPFLQGRRQQQLLVRIVRKVGLLLIDRSARLMLHPIIPPTAHQPCFSGGLLVLQRRIARKDNP